MGGSEENWGSQGVRCRWEEDKEKGEKDDALFESLEGFSLWGKEEEKKSLKWLKM